MTQKQTESLLVCVTQYLLPSHLQQLWLVPLHKLQKVGTKTKQSYDKKRVDTHQATIQVMIHLLEALTTGDENISESNSDEQESKVQEDAKDVPTQEDWLPFDSTLYCPTVQLTETGQMKSSFFQTHRGCNPRYNH